MKRTEENIPKIIHYCWFGEGNKPELLKKCINSWQKYMPDYQIKEWNEKNFDVKMNRYFIKCIKCVIISDITGRLGDGDNRSDVSWIAGFSI